MKKHALLWACVFVALPMTVALGEKPIDSKTYSDAEALRIGWPQLTGPLGNFGPLKADTPLVDDLSQAKLLWTSQTNDLGRAKGGSQAYRRAEQFTGRKSAGSSGVGRFPQAGRHPKPFRTRSGNGPGHRQGPNQQDHSRRHQRRGGS